MQGYKSAILAAAIVIGGASGASASLVSAPVSFVDASRVQIVAGSNNPAGVIKDLIKDLLDQLRGGRNGGGGGNGPHSVPGPVAAAGLPFLLAAGGYRLIRRRRRNRNRQD